MQILYHLSMVSVFRSRKPVLIRENMSCQDLLELAMNACFVFTELFSQNRLTQGGFRVCSMPL